MLVIRRVWESPGLRVHEAEGCDVASFVNPSGLPPLMFDGHISDDHPPLTSPSVMTDMLPAASIIRRSSFESITC